MSGLLQEFTRLTKTLNQQKIDYAICGGWAMAIHGLPRATIDIDLLILSENLTEIWAIVRKLDYDVEALPLYFQDGAIEIRRISKIDEAANRIFTIDFLLVTEALKEVWQTRQWIEWEDGELCAVSREGLIQLKTISARPQDQLDIAKLREIEKDEKENES